MPTLLRMPAEVQALRHPWASVAGEVPGLTARLERDFRFGQRVSPARGGFLLGGSIKGGSSSVWVPAEPALRDVYLAWRAREGLEPGDDRAAFDRLRARLDAIGVGLAAAGPRGQPEEAAFDPRLAIAYDLLDRILSALPEAHLLRPELTALHLGGWGQDGAKASSYDGGVVHIYEFALRGARRTLAGLVLHELGHAQEHAFPAGARQRLREAHRAIAAEEAFYGIEFLLSPEARRAYQRLAPTEFLAETYLAYTACGAGLRAFIEGCRPAARAAWRAVYLAFQDAFEGAEYA